MKQSLSLAQTITAGRIQQAAELKNDESVLVHIRGKDCVAIEVRYHRKCYYKYTKSVLNLKKPKMSLEASAYDKAFDAICTSEIDKRILDGKEVLLLSHILKKFKEAVTEVDVDIDSEVPYQASRLKKRIESRYPQSIVFHPSKSRNIGTLVYSADLVPGEIADDIMEVDQIHSDDNDDDDCYDEIGGNIEHMEACQVFNVAMKMRGILRDTKGVGDWPPDASDLSLVNALQSIPHQLFNFIAWIVGFSDEPDLKHKVSLPHDQCCKVASICQDLIYAEAKGRKQTHKSLALGMTVRQLTGSRKLIDILHGLGHTVSSDTVCTHDSALATLQTSDSVIIPRNVNVGVFSTIVWDNNDFNEETVTGKGTTHVVNGIIIQKGIPSNREKLTVSKKIRSIKAPSTDIEPYFCSRKGIPSLGQQISRDDFEIQDDDILQIPGRNLDLAFVICRIFSTDIGCVVPGWTGFNTKLVREIPELANIGYLPVVDNPASDMATINAILKKSVSICESLRIPEIVAVFDETIYAKVQMLRWKEVEFKKHVVVRLGEFHTIMSFCSGIGKLFKDSGLKVGLIYQ